MTHAELDPTAAYGATAFVPPPNPVLAANAQIGDYHGLYRRSLHDPDAFWRDAAQAITWHQPFTQVLDNSEAPFYKWFVNGQINVVTNALDRHLDTRGEHIALIWEAEGGDVRRLTYTDLHRDVNRFANVLHSLGVRRGDRVAIYMPRIPEQAVAMLATAKIGAVHIVVYGGLSTDALRARIVDAEAKVVVTADGGHLNGKIVELKRIADEAVAQSPSVQSVVYVHHVGNPVTIHDHDRAWHELMGGDGMDAPCPTESMDACIRSLYLHVWLHGCPQRRGAYGRWLLGGCVQRFEVGA